MYDEGFVMRWNESIWLDPDRDAGGRLCYDDDEEEDDDCNDDYIDEEI